MPSSFLIVLLHITVIILIHYRFTVSSNYPKLVLNMNSFTCPEIQSFTLGIYRKHIASLTKEEDQNVWVMDIKLSYPFFSTIKLMPG